MQIDWFTIIAQIINFLILVALLRHFLYRPIIRAMENREAKIAARLAEAEQKSREAQTQIETYREKNQELETLRERRFSEVKKETEACRKEMLQKAREEVNEIQARWKESVQREKNSFLRELRRRVGEQACAVARNALADLAHSDLETLVIESFIKRFREMDPKEREAIQESARKSGQEMLVRTAFELAPAAREQLTHALREPLTDKIPVRFETSPDLIFGIALTVNDRKIAWNLESYLEDLEKNLTAALSRDQKETNR